MEKFVCIHGHFYQPPRENPWLESIEYQGSAYPYHDWNERITAECYAPNAAARILNSDEDIVKIISNYSRMSFNFGPTLLTWMEKKNPEVYQAIIEADKESKDRFSGHGSAMAQCYNHIIMPLSNKRDRITQIVWGIKDFEWRFGRTPEGMWLPETAVDVETLDILAEHGIKFTILAPHQAGRVRKIGTKIWRDVPSANIDPTVAYEINLPSNRKMALFFYDGPISRAVAFEKLLSNGDVFSARIKSGFSDKRTGPQMVHLGTDGETYGHHHRYGEMALAFALDQIENQGSVQLTNYGEFLEKFPPTFEVEIIQNTSWSCAHGIERWKNDCGCNSGMKQGWTQGWRAPLRQSLDFVRDTLAPLYEDKIRGFLKDPWEARNNYISVILNRTPETLNAFFQENAHRALSDSEKTTVLKLLELERQTLLMYTSCGWFFDDLSGIETVQVIQYAGRAIQLAQEVFGHNIEEEFKNRLKLAKSNIPEYQDGRWIYENFVKPSMVDLVKVGAHYAINSLIEENQLISTTYAFDVVWDDFKIKKAGKTKLALGQIHVSSQITLESVHLTFGVLHMGDHNLNGGVRLFQDTEAYNKMIVEMSDAFSKSDFPSLIRVMDRHFGSSTYSLQSLFRDEQRVILNSILKQTLVETDAIYGQVYQNNASLIHYLVDFNIPLPKSLQTAAEFVMNSSLQRALVSDNLDHDQINALFGEAKKANISLDAAGLSFALEETLERITRQWNEDSTNLELLQNLDKTCELVQAVPFEVNLWRVQNVFYTMLNNLYPLYKKRTDQGDASMKEWAKSFRSLGEKLRIRVDQVVSQSGPIGLKSLPKISSKDKKGNIKSAL